MRDRKPPGSKYRYRLAYRRLGSGSAMILFRAPGGKMF